MENKKSSEIAKGECKYAVLHVNQIILVNLFKFFCMQMKVDLHYMYIKSLPLEMLPWV